MCPVKETLDEHLNHMTFIYHDIDADGMLGRAIVERGIHGNKISIPYINNSDDHLVKTMNIVNDVDLYNKYFDKDKVISEIDIVLIGCYFNFEYVINTILKDNDKKQIIRVIIYDHHKTNLDRFITMYHAKQDPNYLNYSHYYSHIDDISIVFNYNNNVGSAMITDMCYNPEYTILPDGKKKIVDYVNDVVTWNCKLPSDSINLNVGLKVMCNYMLIYNTNKDAVWDEVYNKFFTQMLELESQGCFSDDKKWQELFKTYSSYGIEYVNVSEQYGVAQAFNWMGYHTPFGYGLFIIPNINNMFDFDVVALSTLACRKYYDGFVFTISNIDYEKDELNILFRSSPNCKIQLGTECMKFSDGKGGGNDHVASMTLSYDKYRQFLKVISTTEMYPEKKILDMTF